RPAAPPPRPRREPDDDDEDDDDDRPRRRRRKQASSGNTVWWIVGGAAAVLISLLVYCGAGGYRMTREGSKVGEQFQQAMEQAEAEAKARQEQKKNPVVVAAAQLVREFQTNEASAKTKYSGKWVKVTGVVDRVTKGAVGIPTVLLQGAADVQI